MGWNEAVLPSRQHLRLQEIGKRATDITLCMIAIIFLAPLFPLVWLAIRFDSPGPVIFQQQRVGRNNELFTCFKFRTMCHNADQSVHQKAIERLWAGELLSDDPNCAYKMVNDPRVTRVGHWLRKTSIDELPQLFNVLRGEMSLVGPRPAIPYELAYFKEWHHERQSVKPGITGLWQVYGRGCMSLDDMLKLDVEYARTWTVWTDLKLIVLTVPSVIMARGAG
jgi:lipopolysaccharide/colanic/teichoic acid biosynthesis glycosyltransferase